MWPCKQLQKAGVRVEEAHLYKAAVAVAGLPGGDAFGDDARACVLANVHHLGSRVSLRALNLHKIQPGATSQIFCAALPETPSMPSGTLAAYMSTHKISLGTAHLSSVQLAPPPDTHFQKRLSLSLGMHIYTELCTGARLPTCWKLLVRATL